MTGCCCFSSLRFSDHCVDIQAWTIRGLMTSMPTHTISCLALLHLAQASLPKCSPCDLQKGFCGVAHTSASGLAAAAAPPLSKILSISNRQLLQLQQVQWQLRIQLSSAHSPTAPLPPGHRTTHSGTWEGQVLAAAASSRSKV